MNKVTLTIEVTRADPESVQIEILRQGVGDDMVEDRADAIERVLAAFVDRITR